MKILIGLILLAIPLQQTKAPMVEPTVTHHKSTHTVEDDYVDITCPDGFEGHYVRIEQGFMPLGLFTGGLTFNGSSLDSTEPYYAVCFSKEFMDRVRKNPELLRVVGHIRPV